MPTASTHNQKRFFTGFPCVNGHLAERRTCDGKCVVCACQTSVQSAKRSGCGTKARQKYQENNREKIRQSEEHRRTRDAEKVRAQKRAYAWRNIEKERERGREQYRRKPERFRANKAIRRARMAAKSTEGSFTAQDVLDIFRQQRGKCAYCPSSLRRGYHVDHIEPISGKGTNHRRNIQLCCPKCNLSKGKKDPIDFARSLGMLV